MTAPSETIAELREKTRDQLLAEFGDAYDCTRVWSAWSYGTMDEHDFVPLSERVDEIVEGFVPLLTSAARAVESEAEIARLREALAEIRDQHIPSQPMAINVSDAEWAERQHMNLRQIARAALQPAGDA